MDCLVGNACTCNGFASTSGVWGLTRMGGLDWSKIRKSSIFMTQKEQIERCITLATLFDRGYAPRGLVMIESAQLHANDRIEVLALDSHVPSLLSLLNLGEGRAKLRLEHLEDFYRTNELLRSAIENRSRAEAIFTSGPSYLMSLIHQVPEGSWLVYADADIEFHSSLESYLKRFSGFSVVIAPHRHYLWNRLRLAKYGKYNVGVIAFRNDVDGRKVLSNWAQACLEWCSDQPFEGKYADQKYLELFHEWSPKVAVDRHVGANVAPWNSALSKVTGSIGNVHIGGEPIDYVHFQGLKRSPKRWHLGHLQYLSLAGPKLRRVLYLPYLAKLETAQLRLGYDFRQASARPSAGLVAKTLQCLGRLASFAMGQTVSINTIRRYLEQNPSE